MTIVEINFRRIVSRLNIKVLLAASDCYETRFSLFSSKISGNTVLRISQKLSMTKHAAKIWIPVFKGMHGSHESFKSESDSNLCWWACSQPADLSNCKRSMTAFSLSWAFSTSYPFSSLRVSSSFTSMLKLFRYSFRLTSWTISPLLPLLSRMFP